MMVSALRKFDNLDVKSVIRSRIESAAYNAWIEPVSVSKNDNQFNIIAANAFNADFIRKTFANVISDIESEYDAKVIVSVGRPALRVVANDNNICAVKNTFNFDDFVCSESNQFAISAVKKCASGIVSFSPLVIYGATGSGKSMLASMIEKSTPLKTISMTGAQFVSEFVRAMKDGTIFKFKDMLRSCDMFIMDDVQGLASKKASLEEFGSTLSDLIQMGKNVVLTSNIAPSQITGFDKRILSLMMSGLTVDLSTPDKNVCEKILLKNGICEKVAKDISGRVPTNGHILGGIIKKITAWKELDCGDLNETVLEKLFGDVLTKQNTPLSRVKSMCAKLGFAVEDIMSSSRTRAVVFARQKIMVALKMSTDLTLEEIGRLVGRDHASVLYAISQIEKAKGSDLLLSAELADLSK